MMPAAYRSVGSALITKVRAQFGDEEAAALLPARGTETVRALLLPARELFAVALVRQGASFGWNGRIRLSPRTASDAVAAHRTQGVDGQLGLA
ncbi:hypothetical protein [Micromonospora sp. NPDC049274]|uniref:hypothetical protein n=1 Tax=Micromonospora sp. NPDC049274 TaxID=3154829 RepID=UPI00342AC627